MDTSVCVTGGIAPLQLPIANNPVSINGIGNTKGIGLTVGTPNQFFSMRPGVNQNNTFVVNEAYCGTAQNYSCVAENGGVYNPPAGVNRTSVYAAWNGTQGESTKGFTNVFFNDKFQIGGKDVWGVPFYSYTKDSTGFSQPSCLALGINSSFLDAAIASKITGTKQWSLWPGNTYNELDGQLILGGYDADRAGSAFTEMPVVDDTPLYIEITGLSWEHSAGNSTNLMPNNTARLKGTLEPFFDYLTFPYTSNTVLRNALGANYNVSTGYTYSSMPKGNMIVTLSNGQKTTIPATDLFVRPNNYSDRGLLQTTSTTSYWARVYSDENYPNGNLWFGQPFLTQKVIVSQFDQGRYFMADAVKQDLGKTARNLKPLCKGGINGTVTDNKDNGEGKKKSNVGAIAGGVGGGIGALILIAILFFFYRRHMKKSRAQASAASQGQGHQPEVVQAPYRGSMASPPPKYMQAGVYETQDQHGQMLPQSETMPYGGVSPQYGQAGFGQPGQAGFNTHGQTGLNQHSQPGFNQQGQPGFSAYQPQQYAQDSRVSGYGSELAGGTDTRTSGYGSELAAGAPMSPRSDGGFSQGTTEGYSQVGTHQVGSDSHEMSSENKFSATSGPVEMPAAHYRR